MAFRKVASLSDLWSGEKLGLQVDGKRLLLVHVGDAVHAYEDSCPHKGVALSLGHLEEDRLVCSAHNWEYNICTGEGINPRSARLKRLEVKVDNGDILVDLDGRQQPGSASQAPDAGA